MNRASRALPTVLGLLVLACAIPAGAHVNSPHVYVEERLGGYPLMIIVHMPPAVPGEAEVIVRLLDLAADDAVSVQVREIPPQGESHAPAWLEAEPIPEDPESVRAPLPLMVYGMWNAEVRVEGARGTGSTLIPIPARVAPPREMPTGLVVSLLVLIAVLFASCFETLRGLGSDGHRTGTDPPTNRDRLRGVALGVLGVLSFGGFLGFTITTWAMFDELAERRSIPPLTSRLRAVSGPMVAGSRLLLELQVTGRNGRPITDVVQDRGKWMHATLVREPDASLFVKLHPRRSGPGTFAFELTPPEPGRYRLFGDVMFASGETETLVETFEIGPGRSGTVPGFPDPDGTLRVVGDLAPGGRTSEVGDGLVMLRVGPDELRAGDFARLEFELADASGNPVSGLDPYIGGGGHLTVIRDDLEVFARVYPAGTLGLAEAGQSGPAPGSLPPRVSFPYGFPEPGTYRLFVQVRHEGTIRTGVFDAAVSR